MAIADLAAKAVKGISAKKGRKIAKKGSAPKLEKVMPQTIKNTADGKFDVGFAMKETMPDDFNERTYFIAGHHPGQKMTGVHDPITVRAMWLGVGDEGGIILVSADMIGLTNFEVSIIRAGLEDFCKKANCKSVNICCTHTHGGFDTVGYWGKLPRTGKVDSFMKKIFKNIQEVCIEAYENRTKGDLYLGTTHVPEGSIKKREPQVQHDTMTRFRFVPDDGSKETWFINFAAHPNTLGGNNTLCSADYPYFMRETIYKEKDVNVLYSIGAIGAVDPGFPEIEDKWIRTEREGECLGKAALSIDNDEKLNPEITYLCQKFFYTADNAVLSFLGILKVMSTTLIPDNRSDIGMALLSEMTYLKIGKQQIVCLPGEMFPDVAYGGSASAEESATGRGPEINPPTMLEIAKDDDLLIFGVTNDMTGYVVAPNDFILHKTQPYLSNGRDRFDRSHYHETNSLGYSAAKTLTSVFADIMSRVGD